MASSEPKGLAGATFLKAEGRVDEFRRGGLVLLASFLGVGVGVSSLLYYAAGVFVRPLEAAFGWSRAEISAAGLFSTLVLAAASPFIGLLIDRIGIRVVALFSLLAFAAGLFALSAMQGSLLSFYAITILTALLAAGSSPVTFTRAVNGWFVQSRGLALGLALVGTGVAGILAPRLLTPYVAEEGWRAGYRVLAMAVLISTPIVVSLLREGKGVTAQARVSAAQPRLGPPVFLLLTAIFFLVAMAVGGMIVHFIPMLLDEGLSAGSAGGAAAVIGLSVVLGRVITGLLIDRFFAPHVARILFGFAAAGCLAFVGFGPSVAFVTALALGFTMGAEVDLIGYLVARYYALEQYGSIYGRLYAVFLLGAGLSPVLAGWTYDAHGGYGLALLAASVLLAAAAFVASWLPPFPDRQGDNG